jgi:hypothetical protein
MILSRTTAFFNRTIVLFTRMLTLGNLFKRMSENSSEYFGSVPRTPFPTKIGLSETVGAGLEVKLS